MKVTLKSGLFFAALWIGFKLLFFATGWFAYDVVPSVMLNILCLLLAIAIGLFLHKRKGDPEANALSDIKNGLTAGLPYALIVSTFLYFYYEKIDPGFVQHQISEREYELEKMLEDPVKLKEIKASNSDFEVMTQEEILEKGKEQIASNYSPKFTMTVSLLALLLLATLYSILLTVIYRRIIFR